MKKRPGFAYFLKKLHLYQFMVWVESHDRAGASVQVQVLVKNVVDTFIRCQLTTIYDLMDLLASYLRLGATIVSSEDLCFGYWKRTE